MHLKIPFSLPISGKEDIIFKAIQENQVIVVAGDTGSGKTTQLPKICLAAGLGRKKMIACTQPRRLAAIAMANRVGEEIQSPELVASAVRFNDCTTAATRIRFMTDGLLLAEIKGDRLLSRYDTIILDEAHERSLNIDFLIGCLKYLLGRRPELKLIISSATIDTEKFSDHFANAPIITVSGRMFPVKIRYMDESEDEADGSENMVKLVCTEVLSLCEKPGGDILVFMATERDIMDSMAILQGRLDPKRHLILPLFSRLQSSEQRKIFQSVNKRKVIIATNIAETSITVPGIHFVIDSGQARIPAYNVRARTTSLRVRRISKASCTQRAGRAGRTAPGTCIRLYSEEDYLSRAEFTRPEIQRSNLAEVILQMISLGLGDPRQFPFLDPPLPRAVNEGFRILYELGAITDIKSNKLTGNGRIMARLPLDPAISRVLIEAASLNCLEEVSIISAALSIQDPRMRPTGKEQQAKEAQGKFTDPRSDFITLLNIWNRFFEISKGKKNASALGKFSKKYFLSWQRMREWFDIHEQINRQLKSSSLKPLQLNKKTSEYEPVHRALCSGFLRNIGQKKKKEKNTYVISGGKEAVIFPGSCLHNRKRGNGASGQWIVAADFIETSRLFARTVALIDEGWLEELGGSLCKYNYTGYHWSKKIGQVQAMERVTLFGLPIVAGRKINYGKISDNAREEAEEIFIQQALVDGELGGIYPFLKHNLNLIENMEEMANRLRRHNIIADDQALYEFYKNRICGAYDRFTLNRLLKRKKSDQFLFMKIEDISGDKSAQDELYKFPKSIRSGSVEFKLSYIFQPGSERDGVTVHLPEQQLENISPPLFEWLVPGLLDEKILHLLKKLPRKIRRNLVPIPDAVERIMDRLDTYRGSLYSALEKAVRQEYQLEINRTDWQISTLPLHLLIRYQLVDRHGKTILSSRRLSEIISLPSSRKGITNTPANGVGAQNSRQKKSSTKIRGGETGNISYQKTGITNWDFTGINVSASIFDSAGNLSFPALIASNERTSVDFCYINDRQKAAELTRSGIQTLYCLQFPGCYQKTVNLCKTALTNHSASWLSLGINSTAAELRNNLIDFIFTDLFQCRNIIIPDKKTFDQVILTLKKHGIYRKISEILELIINIIGERRKTREVINTWQEHGRKNKNTDQAMELDFQDWLNSILPADFLFSRSPAEIKEAGRYLQALRVRVERANHDPLKDKKKQTRLNTVVKRLSKLNDYKCILVSQQCRQVISRYRTMVEEFRVSVFAPELGTRMVVSEKRLKKLWQEVENHCRRVE